MKKIAFLLSFMLISFPGSNVSSQNPKTEGYKGIWFTLGQFSEYGELLGLRRPALKDMELVVKWQYGSARMKELHG
jgi:hypothetical protein